MVERRRRDIAVLCLYPRKAGSTQVWLPRDRELTPHTAPKPTVNFSPQSSRPPGKIGALLLPCGALLLRCFSCCHLIWGLLTASTEGGPSFIFNNIPSILDWHSDLYCTSLSLSFPSPPFPSSHPLPLLLLSSSWIFSFTSCSYHL